MALPAFDATKHDVGINGIGYMLASGQKQDLRPGTTRASSGEGRFDSFESESFHAQSEFGGGQGQQRFSASDQSTEVTCWPVRMCWRMPFSSASFKMKA